MNETQELVDQDSIRKGDVISKQGGQGPRITVEDINGPQRHSVGGKQIRQWTFDGPDETGRLRALSFRQGEEKVLRYRSRES